MSTPTPGDGATAPQPPAQAAAGPRGPVSRAERSLAPDLARGAVLLFIALANVTTYFYGVQLEPGHRPIGGGLLDNVLDVVVTAVVDRRSYPMFALLFGYGMVQLMRRQLDSGAEWPAVRAILLRRNAFLVLFGAVHALLLFTSDILGPYGATGLLVTLLFLHRSPRVLAVWTAVSVVLLSLLLGFTDPATAGLTDPGEGPSYLLAAVNRLVEWGVTLAVSTVLIGLLGPMLIGVRMARAGLLDRPWEHEARLRRIAGVGIPLGVLGGLPYGLTVGGFWNPDPLVNGAVGVLHTATGVAAGAGYVALFGLIALRLRGRDRSGLVGAIAATGERSLTCYLWQSVLFAPLLAAWGFGLGDQLGTTAAYGLAVAVWVSGVGLAVLLARAGSRGPAETLLRRLVYRRR
jgi:uncharacterized membrane protein YeiB